MSKTECYHKVVNGDIDVWVCIVFLSKDLLGRRSLEGEEVFFSCNGL